MTDQDPTTRLEPPAAAPAALPPAHPAATAHPDDLSGPDASPVPTSPVAGGTAARRPGSRLRWLLAGLVVLVVAVGAAGATLLLTSDSADPAVLAWAPADTVTYAEARLDLPGSQAAELAKVMRAFPGFDDQAAFPAKLNELLDQLTGRASDGKVGWSADIDPWFGRQVSVSMGPLPAGADAKDARFLALASVKDRAKAESFFAKLATDAGATTATETYGGVTITTVTPPAADARGMTGAWAILGPVVALGDPASVRAAIDTQGRSGLPTVAQFRTAEATVAGDRLGFAYVDAKALAQGAKDLAGEAASSLPSLPAALDGLTPDWTVAAVRAANGAFVIDTRNPHLAQLSGPAKPSETTLASVLPPTTVALVEGHDVGAALTRFKELAASDPSAADGVKQLEDALRIVGGWDAVVGWMGEAGVAVTVDGTEASGGLLVTPTSRADAERLLTQLRGFIELAGGASGVSVTDEDYGGTTVTTVRLAGIGALAGGMTGSQVPLPDDVSISYAVTDEVVVLGYGTAFTKAVLDARGGASLATSARFADARAAAGTTHASLAWVDVAGIRALAEGMLPAAERGAYESDVKPYLDAFDSVIATLVPGEDVDRGTVIIRVTGR